MKQLRSGLENWLRFVQSETHLFRESPDLLFQTAANALEFEGISIAALQRFEAGREKSFWFRAVKRLPRQSHRRLTLTGHAAAVTACSFSRDGSRILSASKDGTVQISSASTGFKILEIEASDEELGEGGLRSYDDDDFILSAESDDGRSWESFGSRVNWNRNLRLEACERAAFSTDGARILSLTHGHFQISDVYSGSTLCSRIVQNRALGRWCAFSADGHLLAVDFFDWDSRLHSIKLLDPTSGESLVVAEQLSTVGHCELSPDGSLLFIGNGGGRLFNTQTGDLVLSLSDSSSDSSLCVFAHDGSLLIFSIDRTLVIWNVVDKQLVFTFAKDYATVSAASFSADLSQILLGSTDGSLEVFDVDSREKLYSWSGHTSSVVAVGFSNDGLSLVSGSSDGTVKVWEKHAPMKSGRASHSRTVTSCVFSPDGTRLATSSLDRTVKIWDGYTCDPLTTISLDRSVHDCAYSPDGRWIACVVGMEVHVFDSSTGERARILGPARRMLNVCAFSPDGEELLVAGNYGLLLVWNTSTGQRTKNLYRDSEDVTACAYSPTGEYALSGDVAGLVHIWMLTGRRPTSAPLRGHRSAITSVAFSPDERTWISASRDGTVRHWKGRESGRAFCGHNSAVSDCDFSPNGRLLVSSSADGTLKLWEITSGQELARYDCEDSITHVAWSHDGARIVLTTVSGGLELLQVEGFEPQVVSVNA